jgi:sensor histidine kinase regulating citrate/malate metabolism
MGLAAVNHIMDSIGGKITVKSKKAKGSVFTIGIPRPLKQKKSAKKASGQ